MKVFTRRDGRYTGGAGVLARAAVCIALLSAGCGGDWEYEVRLSASGSAADVAITYQNQEGTVNIPTTTLPWSTEFTFKPRRDDFGDNRCVTAKNNTDTGSITVSAYTDGDLDARNSCEGKQCQVTACSRYVYASADDFL